MHALDHGAVLRRHQPRRLRAGNAERVHGLLRIEPQRRCRAGGGREHADRCAGMPALADMLLSHAHADARADLVAGDGGGAGSPGLSSSAWHSATAISAGRVTAPTCSTAERWTSSSSKLWTSVPLTSAACGEDSSQRCPRPQVVRVASSAARYPQDAAPFEPGAIDRAAERIEDQQFDARADLRRDSLISQLRDKLGDGAGVNVIGTDIGRSILGEFMAGAHEHLVHGQGVIPWLPAGC